MSAGASGPNLIETVAQVLHDSERPLLAREIAERIDATRASTLKTEVNRVLYGPLASFVEQVDQFRWRLTRTPRFAASSVRQPRIVVQEPAVEPQLPVVDAASLHRVAGVLGAWKRDLIDFGRRNKVLYFNSSRRTKLRLLAPSPEDLYEGLVLREKAYSFAIPATGSIELAELTDSDDDGAGLRERSGDIVVDYEHSSAADVRILQRKLYRLKTDANSVLNEQGINTLHLGLGLLRWREADTDSTWIESPIVLVPVSLQREKNKPYMLLGFDGDVVVSPALIHRLTHDFEIELPSFDPFDGFGERAKLHGYFEAVESLVRDRGWTVIDDAWLTHLSFEKLVMFEDLSQPGTEQEAATHPVVGSMIGVRELDSPEVSFEKWAPSFELPEAYPVVDADFSQVEVLARARAGQSFVVQGPPGTGKSQTIVNLIAQAIRDGRTVLFVSEKRAALDVVHRRLRGAGLADLCLELHSHKTNKREVVRDLYLGMQQSLGTVDSPDAGGFDERRALRQRLDDYVIALHTKRGGSDRTAYLVQGRLALLVNVPIVRSQLPVASCIDLERGTEQDLMDAIRGVHVTGVWDRAPDHVWRDAVFVEPAFLIQQALIPDAMTLDDALTKIADQLGLYQAVCGTPGIESVDDLDRLLVRLGLLSTTPGSLPPEWLTMERTDFDAARAGAAAATDAANDADHLGAALDANDLGGLRGSAPDVERLATAYGTAHASFANRLLPAYRRDRRALRVLVGRKVRYKDAATALSLATRFHEARRSVADAEPTLRAALGVSIPDAREERNSLRSTLDWAALLRDSYGVGGIPTEATTKVSSAPDEVRSMAQSMESTIRDELSRTRDGLVSAAGWFPNGIDGVPLASAPLARLRARLSGWVQGAASVEEWASFDRAVRRCDELGLTDFLNEARASQVASSDLEAAFERLLLTKWLVEAYLRDAPLAAFGLNSHEDARRRFARLDKGLLSEAQQAVLRTAHDRQEVVRQAAAFQDLSRGRHRYVPDRKARDEFKLIRREHEKKRRHLPLRRLLPLVPSILPSVKPCLLMSPLSVANYLPRSAYKFDLVIFDEASQVLPADAIGAILRGSQLIVLGDSKQLPPTRFFQRQLGYEDDGEDFDEDAVDATAFDSILEVCATTLPATALRWHYRSRDERLIAFSNRRFYNERPLITFPTANPGGDTGVRFRYVPDGVYDRGGNKVNTVEAQVVADLVTEHFQRYGWDRSLGVITLSLSQRDAVDYEIKRRAIQDPELETFLAESGNEPFFVKNLETVQGDERDSIIISLGYGPSEPGGLPALFFGPVNAAGGERRLNVAVTRAKFEVTLVSSMRPEHLDRTADLRNEGPKVLAEYVRYASRGGRFEEAGVVSEGLPGSPFEEAVMDALTARGYVVDPQVGASHYKIDLAVRHPDVPTRYVLGIECDGATYHSSADARERDRLRQEVLEYQGWTIYRIWSTDWLQHPDATLASLLEHIESIRRTDQAGIRIEETPKADLEEPRLEGFDSPDVDVKVEEEAPALPVPFLEEQREALTYERTRLERQLEGFGPRDPSTRESDKGLASEQVRRTLNQRLEHVLEALRRLDDGTYGTCQSCGGLIEVERLEAVPSTPLCRSCSQTHE